MKRVERAGVSSVTEADGAYSTNMNSSFYMHKRYMALTKYITKKIYIVGLQGVTIIKKEEEMLWTCVAVSNEELNEKLSLFPFRAKILYQLLK